ncbi:MAG TPA: D-alanyl-D-alanine carboxypeptidase/D-alanyl-D-alanine-endopeptidase [Elusimicrobiales bacterium]|nr:D-alanyl-D-alanine carboxypeptidase/D-alanyl-D-alanine-endopeptidase [Elusimicrobiales bacterium]
MVKILLFALLLVPAKASAQCAFREKMALPGFSNASWGLSVRDVSTGKELVSCAGSANLVPASSLKMFVTAAALDVLGPETRFKTRVYLDGSVSKGVLEGGVYIRGGGDPSFASQFINGAPSAEAEFARWAAALREAGVSSVKGSVTADDTLFEGQPLPGSWTWEDIGNYYAAQPSALVFNDNLYRLYFRPGKEEGVPAAVLRSEPEISGLVFENLMTTGPEGSGDNGYIFNFPGRYSAVVRGTVPRGAEEFAIKGAMPDPALFAAQAFTDYLSAHGIKVEGKAARAAGPVDYGAARFLAETEGAQVKDIVFATNKRSFNLYAEILLRHLAVAAGKAGSASNGLAALRAYLASRGMDVSELRLADASGLSRLNMVQASQFSAFLAAVASRPFFGAYRASLVRPQDPDATGHVRRLGADTRLKGLLQLKSGSLSGVRSYAGYLTTDKGRLLSFASLLNNYSAPASGIDAMHEAILLELAEKY